MKIVYHWGDLASEESSRESKEEKKGSRHLREKIFDLTSKTEKWEGRRSPFTQEGDKEDHSCDKHPLLEGIEGRKIKGLKRVSP